MRIAIAARGLSIRSGGAKEYIRQLVSNLVKVDRENTYFVYYSSMDSRLGLTGPNVQEVVLGKCPNLLWDHIVLPLRMKRDSIDVSLYLKGTIPLISSARSVVSVLDFGYFYPGLNAYKLFDTIYIKYMMPWSIKRAHAVLSISHNTRLDILRFVPGIDPQKINVTYLASSLETEFHHSSKPLQFKDAPYIFISSSLSPRKNIERVVEAMAKVSAQIPHRLVITGGKAWGRNRFNELVEKHDLQDRVVLLGHVEKSELVCLYKGATLYIMPSLYEGFSLTVLEAMQAGCPVAASNVSSHPEVVGDAALLFDPYSAEAIADVILRIVRDPALQADLRQKGFAQCQKFTWERCALDTLEVIKRVSQIDE